MRHSNLDEKGNRIPAKQKGRWKTHKENDVDWDDRGKAEIWRAAAADAINDALREAGFTQGFVDHRSYARQGIERIPMVHAGPDARAMEKRGIRTEVATRIAKSVNRTSCWLPGYLNRLFRPSAGTIA